MRALGAVSKVVSWSVGAGVALATLAGSANADWRGHSRGGSRCDSRSGLSISFSTGWNSGWHGDRTAVSFSSGWSNRCDDRWSGRDRWNDCDRPRVCAPIVYSPPVYCPPPVVYRPVIIERPRPVYVERCESVLVQPVVVERPACPTVTTVTSPVCDPPRVIPAVYSTGSSSSSGSSVIVKPRGFVAACDSETAALYWSTGDAGKAIEGLRAHLLDHPEDAKAKRLLGIIYIDQGHAPEGAGWVYDAYNADPSLTSKPFDAAAAGVTVDQMKAMQRAVLDYATQANSPSSWLTVIALLQAEGKNELAKSTVTKAVEAGLPALIVDPLRAALGS